MYKYVLIKFSRFDLTIKFFKRCEKFVFSAKTFTHNTLFPPKQPSLNGGTSVLNINNEI